MPTKTLSPVSRWALVAVLSLTFTPAAFAESRELTVSEAKDLVFAALDPAAQKLPNLRTDSNNDPSAPDFYGFDVTFENHTGSPVVGFYAVNRRTGDVWRLVVCRSVTSPALERLQKTLRTKMHTSAQDLRESRLKKPCEP